VETDDALNRRSRACQPPRHGADDVIVEEFGLDVEPLVGLARIVRGADTGKARFEGCGSGMLGDARDLGRGHELEHGAGIDESAG
jgi:hypothetical protein